MEVGEENMRKKLLKMISRKDSGGTSSGRNIIFAGSLIIASVFLLTGVKEVLASSGCLWEISRGSCINGQQIVYKECRKNPPRESCVIVSNTCEWGGSNYTETRVESCTGPISELTPCCNTSRQPACGKEEIMCYQGRCYPEFHCWFDAGLCGETSSICATPTSRPSDIPPPPSPTITATVTTAPGCTRKSQGDANCNGNVDGIDYSIWLNNQCHPEAGQTCADTRADFNGDGNVDDSDYNIWLSGSS